MSETTCLRLDLQVRDIRVRLASDLTHISENSSTAACYITSSTCLQRKVRRLTRRLERLAIFLRFYKFYETHTLLAQY